MRARGKGGQRHHKPLSEAQQVAIAAQVLDMMANRHFSAADSFKRSGDDDMATAETENAEKLRNAAQVLRQNRLLAPAIVHDMVHRRAS